MFDEYSATSDRLRQLLPSVEGFKGIERFKSCSDDDKYVAIGFFDDEDAVAAWRNTPEHRQAQALGRRRLFTDYRLRMATITRDYTATKRTEAPRDSRRAHEREARA
ncbi:MAG: antibiotic biosynthesis monooxygenase [Ilumatobacter sp.]